MYMHIFWWHCKSDCKFCNPLSGNPWRHPSEQEANNASLQKMSGPKIKRIKKCSQWLKACPRTQRQGPISEGNANRPDSSLHQVVREETQQIFEIAGITIGDKLQNLVSKSGEKNANLHRSKIYPWLLRGSHSYLYSRLSLLFETFS